MYSVDAAAIFHLEVQLIKWKRILVFEMLGQDLRTEKEKVLEKVDRNA
jgi:hypothetical protein